MLSKKGEKMNYSREAAFSLYTQPQLQTQQAYQQQAAAAVTPVNFSFAIPTITSHTTRPSCCDAFKVTKVNGNSVEVKKIGGAQGYLLVESTGSSLEQRIRTVVAGILSNQVKDLIKREFDYCSELELTNERGYPAIGPCCINTLIDTNLRECSCKDLDRYRNPDIRRNYENAVIHKALAQIKKQLEHEETFTLDIAVFAPGFLASEAILMVRLLKILRREGYEGSITINLIDTAYNPLVDGKSLTKVGYDPLNQTQAIGAAAVDFMNMVESQTGQDIYFKARIFKHGDDYKLFCENNRDRENDLVIGSDIDSGLKIAQDLYLSTNVTGTAEMPLKGKKAVLLYRDQSGPKFWGHNLNFVNAVYQANVYRAQPRLINPVQQAQVEPPVQQAYAAPIVRVPPPVVQEDNSSKFFWGAFIGTIVIGGGYLLATSGNKKKAAPAN